MAPRGPTAGPESGGMTPSQGRQAPSARGSDPQVRCLDWQREGELPPRKDHGRRTGAAQSEDFTRGDTLCPPVQGGLPRTPLVPPRRLRPGRGSAPGPPPAAAPVPAPGGSLGGWRPLCPPPQLSDRGCWNPSLDKGASGDKGVHTDTDTRTHTRARTPVKVREAGSPRRAGNCLSDTPRPPGSSRLSLVLCKRS